jgi:spore maturation protein CgeB
MKLVVFGLTISSSWGNGHATVWRGLLRELIRNHHDVTFFERDVPYYATHRDFPDLPGGALRLYSSWERIREVAEQEVASADVAIATSYCPDAISASELIWQSNALRVFYDLDAPVTLARVRRGESVPYLPPQGLSNFDLVLSFTGGKVLDALRAEFGATNVAALYGSVDPDLHRPVGPMEHYRSDLSYLGTFSQDRQQTLQELFIEPARRARDKRFLMAGAQYPMEFPWTENIFFVQHLAPADHPHFFCSSRLTLNVTRDAMRQMGWCPSGRLFEAAACGTPIVTDTWPGLDEFFEPGVEILVASNSDDITRVLEISDSELRCIASAARERTLAEHSAAQRAKQFENIVEAASTRQMAAA